MPSKQLVAHKIARMSAPVVESRPKPFIQKIARMSAPVTTGILPHSSDEDLSDDNNSDSNELSE